MYIFWSDLLQGGRLFIIATCTNWLLRKVSNHSHIWPVMRSEQRISLKCKLHLDLKHKSSLRDKECSHVYLFLSCLRLFCPQLKRLENTILQLFSSHVFIHLAAWTIYITLSIHCIFIFFIYMCTCTCTCRYTRIFPFAMTCL